MNKKEKKLLLDCKNQFEWLASNEEFGMTTSTKTIIRKIDIVLVENNINEKKLPFNIKQQTLIVIVSSLMSSVFAKGDNIIPENIIKAFEDAEVIYEEADKYFNSV